MLLILGWKSFLVNHHVNSRKLKAVSTLSARPFLQLICVFLDSVLYLITETVLCSFEIRWKKNFRKLWVTIYLQYEVLSNHFWLNLSRVQPVSQFILQLRTVAISSINTSSQSLLWILNCISLSPYFLFPDYLLFSSGSSPLQMLFLGFFGSWLTLFSPWFQSVSGLAKYSSPVCLTQLVARPFCFSPSHSCLDLASFSPPTCLLF